jgi:hypothetical protein
MCRNITILRGLEPVATRIEIEAAARQYVRKVGGLRTTSRLTEDAFERAARKIADATEELLTALPPRQQAPRSEPPLRRIEARKAAQSGASSVG